MERRDFFRRAALVAAGVVAADQLDLLERLTWKRRFFPGWSEPAQGWQTQSGTWGISGNSEYLVIPARTLVDGDVLRVQLTGVDMHLYINGVERPDLLPSIGRRLSYELPRTTRFDNWTVTE
jgi:hypothetical protein